MSVCGNRSGLVSRRTGWWGRAGRAAGALDQAARRALAAVRSHPRHLVLGCLVAGLLASPSPPLLLALVIAAATLAPRLPLVVATALALFGGALIAQARQQALDRTALGPSLEHAISARATLLERPRRSRSGSRYALAVLTDGLARGERIVLSLGGRRSVPAEATPGAEVAVTGRLVALSDHDGFLRRRGAHARLLFGSLRSTGARRGGLAGALDRLRAGAEGSVAAGLDGPRAALARGMVLGEDEGLDERDREAFRASGLAHLLAASGQNVMLLGALALPVLALMGLGLRARLVGALALVALYVPLAGAGPSIQRAGVMGAAGMVAALAGRPASRCYAVLLAAAATLAFNPGSAGDPGWQLSFAAVVAILVVAPRLAEALCRRGVARPVADACAVTAGATLATGPLMAFYFGRLSLISLPANLLAAPAVAPVMWLGMAAAAVGWLVPAAAALINALAQFPLAYLGWLAHAAASLPVASVGVRIGSASALVGVYVLLASSAMAVVRLPRRTTRRLLGPLVALAAVGVAFGLARARPPPPDPRALIVSFLDVGQGDATLVQAGGAAMLVDTGPPGGPLLSRLRRAGVRRLDVLVITHAQADHEGETAAVLRRFPVGLLLDGGAGTPTPEHRAIVEAAKRRRVPRVTPDAGETLRAGPLELRVLWPHREPAARHAGEDPNQRAIVARLRDGDFDLLLPADAEADVTSALDLGPVEALKVAHHGSEDPGLPDMLRRLHPRLAVVEVGRHNTYGHPTAQALGALRAVPGVYRTDRDGTVRLVVEGGRMTVATHR